MTPIWQAECPGLDEDTADDLWRAAFEPWPRGGEHHEAQPDLAKLLGLPKGLTPQPRLPVERCPILIHLVDSLYLVRLESLQPLYRRQW